MLGASVCREDQPRCFRCRDGNADLWFHRMPSSNVHTFVFGPKMVELDQHRDSDDEQPDSERAGWPLESSWTNVDFFGAKGILFAWSDAAWAIEPNKPDAWRIRDGRLLIVPAGEWEVRPWAGRSERFGVAKSLDIEVNATGIVAIYNVSPPRDEDAMPSARATSLAGNGGIPWLDIVFRKDLLEVMNVHHG